MHKQLKQKLFFIGLQLLAGVLFMPAFALAQSAGVLPDPVQYVVNPETPGPNQQVSIEAQGVGSFLGDATITWSRDGQVVLQGVGARDYSFTTGPLGSQTHLHVDINSSTNGSFSHDFYFLPSAVNLVWEADTSVPPLYRGKALYSAGSGVKVVAFPIVVINGRQIAASALSYQWSLNNNPMPAQSGTGLSTFSFTGDQLQSEEDVSVDVYYGASKLGTGSIAIPVTNPELVLYDRDALRGVLWDEALPSALSLTATEFTIEAVPYYFSNASLKGGALTYAWTLGDNAVTGPNSAQGILTLRQTGSGTGAAALNVSLQNNDTDKLVQTAQAAIQIVFGQSTSNAVSSFFGL